MSFRSCAGSAVQMYLYSNSDIDHRALQLLSFIGEIHWRRPSPINSMMMMSVLSLIYCIKIWRKNANKDDFEISAMIPFIVAGGIFLFS